MRTACVPGCVPRESNLSRPQLRGSPSSPFCFGAAPAEEPGRGPQSDPRTTLPTPFERGVGGGVGLPERVALEVSAVRTAHRSSLTLRSLSTRSVSSARAPSNPRWGLVIGSASYAWWIRDSHQLWIYGHAAVMGARTEDRRGVDRPGWDARNRPGGVR